MLLEDRLLLRRQLTHLILKGLIERCSYRSTAQCSGGSPLMKWSKARLSTRLRYQRRPFLPGKHP